METETQAVETESAKSRQKEAVFKYVTQVLEGQLPQEGQAVRDLVTKEVRKEVRQLLFDGFKSGQIKLIRQMDDSRLKKYCSGLINNWLKKDSRYN